jgi:hypothetical protein
MQALIENDGHYWKPPGKPIWSYVVKPCDSVVVSSALGFKRKSKIEKSLLLNAISTEWFLDSDLFRIQISDILFPLTAKPEKAPRVHSHCNFVKSDLVCDIQGSSTWPNGLSRMLELRVHVYATIWSYGSRRASLSMR